MACVKIAVVLLSVFMATGCASKDECNAADIVGKWVVEDSVENGKQVASPPEKAKAEVWDIGGGAVKLTVDAGVAVSARYVLDTSVSPCRITMVFVDGPYKGRSLKGLWKIAGNKLFVITDNRAESNFPDLTDFDKKTALGRPELHYSAFVK